MTLTDAPVPGAAPSLHIDGAIANLTLRRPQVANRLELSDLDLLMTQIAQVNADEAVRVLLLAAEGRHFCSGFNLGKVGAAGSGAGNRFEALASVIETARPITVARIQGGAFGGAVDLSLACDFRIGTTACQMFIPAARLGLHFYRGGMERLVTRLGLGAAKRLLLAVETLDAAALQGIGLLDRVVEPEALQAETDGFCRQLAALAPLALLPMKRHLNAIARGELDAAALAADIEAASASADIREGAAAWAEKRAPRFEGR
jgi:enoyl-CoA hydratase